MTQSSPAIHNSDLLLLAHIEVFYRMCKISPLQFAIANCCLGDTTTLYAKVSVCILHSLHCLFAWLMLPSNAIAMSMKSWRSPAAFDTMYDLYNYS